MVTRRSADVLGEVVRGKAMLGLIGRGWWLGLVGLCGVCADGVLGADEGERGAALRTAVNDRVESTSSANTSAAEIISAFRSSQETRPESAADSFELAMRAEIDGNATRRRQLLESIAESDPSFPASHWQLGEMRDSKRGWMTIESSIEVNRRNVKLAQYEERRALSADTVAGHWELAEWCERNRLPLQRRAHLNRILQIDANHGAARSALGHRSLGDGGWMTAEQLALGAERASAAKKSLDIFGTRLRKIAQDLLSSRENIVIRGQDELDGIQDPRAIPAFEAVFSTLGVPAVDVGLKWLGQMDHQEAALSLLRFAIFHPNGSVREVAIEQLTQRDLYEFGPQLMEMVRAPMATSVEPVISSEGTLRGFRQAFLREGATQDSVYVVDTAIRPEFEPTSSTVPREAAEIANRNAFVAAETLGRAQARLSSGQQQAEAENQAARWMNERVSRIVSQVSGRNVAADPQLLWKWWYATNDSYRPENRSTSYRRDYDEIRVRAPSPTIVSRSTATGGSCECFAEGTPVLTLRGMVAIEKVDIGDLVLSKQTTTGELSWKPVLARTAQPPLPVVEVQIGDELFRCTRGHLFWASGHGWARASELGEEDILHGAKEPRMVQSVTPAGELPTFNLVVADNATYFVGENLVLSHDFTDRPYVAESVPGWRPK